MVKWLRLAGLERLGTMAKPAVSARQVLCIDGDAVRATSTNIAWLCKEPEETLGNLRGSLGESGGESANCCRLTSSHVLLTGMREHTCFGSKFANGWRLARGSLRHPRIFLGDPRARDTRDQPPIALEPSKQPFQAKPSWGIVCSCFSLSSQGCG